MLRRFYVATLGCKVNQYESEAIREAWLAKGLEQASCPEEAQLILVNSCAVTAKAVADVRYCIRQMHRLAPFAKIVVTGCAAKLEEQNLKALAGVSHVVEQGQKIRLVDMQELEACVAENSPEHKIPSFERKTTTVAKAHSLVSNVQQTHHTTDKNAPKVTFQDFKISGYDRSRAVVKVQDGCSHRCTYCIVPLTRGSSCSRLPAQVVAEVERLLNAGFREIGLSGVNLRQYGAEFAKPFDFWDLLNLLEQTFAPNWAGQMRFRLSSLEPGQLGSKAFDTFAGSKLLAPHLHLSLQSGSTGVLKRMGRGHYDPATALEFTQKLTSLWPVFGLGADILTGFPQESELEFQETFGLCQKLPLSYAHVFPYSKRPGTPAALMKNQVLADVKKERAKLLRTLILAKQQEFLNSLLSVPEQYIVTENLTEHRKNNTPSVGVNAQYADCEFATQSFTSKGHTLMRVRPLRVERGKLIVEPS